MLSIGVFQNHSTKVVLSTAQEASHVIVTSAAWVSGFAFSNANGSARTAQLFDSATLPSDGVFPNVIGQSTATAASAYVSYVNSPFYFASGIVICNSSTVRTKTIGSADSLFAVWYVTINT